MNVVKKRIGSNQKGNASPRITDSGGGSGGMFGSSSSPSNNTVPSGASDDPNLDGLSPELIPIVTLLSSQSHRRYNEGIFMLYYDLNGDGKPADREWREVYGILTGNQLAYWDAAILAQFKNNADALLEASAKPSYINFTDAVYSAMKTLPAAKQNLDNVVVVSTTLKNRYILQFKSVKDLETWYCALRLSSYEYNSLQSAYTGALLSARGSRLSDIRTILAEKRFDHEDWISIRYGSGMAWKRCYAVVEPSTLKRKTFVPGRILLFENEQKKKKQLMAVITDASSIAAIYPQSHLLIDHSTMIKMEGFINFSSPSLSTKVSKKNLEDFKQTSIFLMPEQHSAVPGFDTLIRFLVPLFDTFGLYGRPKRLKANRNDVDSLLFGLPTLPRVHYLELSDVEQLVSRGNYFSWDLRTWNLEIQNLLKSKIERGYDGCGSQRGYAGAVSSLNSPALSSSPRLPSSGSSSTFRRKESSNLSRETTAQTGRVAPPTAHATSQPQPPPPPPHHQPDLSAGGGKRLDKNIKNLEVEVPAISPQVKTSQLAPGAATNPHNSVQLAEIYQKYSDLKTPSDNYIDRREVLNGSHEQLNEDDLPLGIRQMNLEGNMYPKNDDDLFSDDEEEEEDGSLPETENGKSPKLLDVRTMGKNTSESSVSAGSLRIPSQEQNGSYSSVISPMAQFNDLHDEYKQVGKNVPFYGLQTDSSPQINSDRDLSSRQQFGASLDNTKSFEAANEQQRSAYPQQAGKTDTQVSGGAPYPTNKPRYIMSPNSSQNQFNQSEAARKSPSPVKKDLQYPVSPQRKAPPTDSSGDHSKAKTNIPKSNKQIFVPLGGQPGQDRQQNQRDYRHQSPQPGGSEFERFGSQQDARRVGAKSSNQPGQQQPLPQFQVSTPNQTGEPRVPGQHSQPSGRQPPPPQQQQQQQQYQQPLPPQQQQRQYQQRPPPPPQQQQQQPPMNAPMSYGGKQPRPGPPYQGHPQQHGNHQIQMQSGPQRNPNMGMPGHQPLANGRPQQQNPMYQPVQYGQPNSFRSYDNQQYQYTPNVVSPGGQRNTSQGQGGQQSASRHPYAQQYSRAYNHDGNA